MVNPTTSPLIFSKLLYNIYLPLPIFLPPTNKNYLVIFLNPSPPELPFLRSLPYISLRKTQGRCPKDGGVEKTQQGERIGLQSPLPCRVLWHYGELQNIIGRKGYFSILSPCVSVREYRGSARRARGLERWHIVFL